MGKISLSSISSDLRDIEISEEALPAMQTLLSLFGNDTINSSAVHVREVVEKDRFGEEDSEVKQTFLRTGYFLGVLLPSLEEYDGKRWRIREPKLKPLDIKRVYGTHEFSSSWNNRKSFVLL